MNRKYESLLTTLIPAALFLAGTLLVVLIGAASERKDGEQIALETRITAEQVRLRLESCINARTQLIDALARQPWTSEQQLIESWNQPAGTLLPLHNGVLALNYVSPAGVIRVVYPPATNQSALNADLTKNQHPSVRRALRRALEASQLQRSNVVELLQSGKGFALYQQIQGSDGAVLGFVNGVFRINDLMDSCLSEQPLRNQFNLTLHEDDELLYRQPKSAPPAEATYRVNLPIDVAGRPWQLSLSPLENYLQTRDSIFEKIWFGLGLLLMLLLALATRSLLIKQRTLRDSEDKYRLLVENQTDMVVKVDPEGRFQYVSPSYCEVFGITEDALLNRQFMPLVHVDDQERTAKSLESLKHPPHSSYHEQRAMTHDGWRWLGWSNTAVLNESGEIAAITAVGRDITQIKKLEENIARSRKMTAFGEMAGGITHDFNNLLQVIMGNIECLLLNDRHDHKTKESLEQVVKIVERAMNLTGKLATLSRQELTQREVFDLNEFLKEVTMLLEHTLPANVVVSLSPASVPLMVFADKTLIEQVVLNLCFNARDAIDAHGHLTIQSGRRTFSPDSLREIPDIEPGDYAFFTVEDDGCGIEADVLPRIFDPFFTTKASGTGTGLGLSNCYSIVKRHDGMIQVSSEVNKGTQFSVYLPITKAAMESKASRPARPDRADIAAKKRVLIADDDADILRLTRRTLESAGFETLGASDGREALALYERHRDEIGLVVLDLVMPEMSGQEVAEHIRANDDRVKVLFVTGYIPESQSLNLDDPVIRKPYKREFILQTISELLSNQSSV